MYRVVRHRFVGQPHSPHGLATSYPTLAAAMDAAEAYGAGLGADLPGQIQVRRVSDDALAGWCEWGRVPTGSGWGWKWKCGPICREHPQYRLVEDESPRSDRQVVEFMLRDRDYTTSLDFPADREFCQRIGQEEAAAYFARSADPIFPYGERGEQLKALSRRRTRVLAQMAKQGTLSDGTTVSAYWVGTGEGARVLGIPNRARAWKLWRRQDSR